MVLIDSDSTDRTREIAEDLGVPVHIHQKILPQYGARPGKGEALWKSLYCTQGDIIIWIDTDIVNIHSRFVYGLIAPLLLRPEIHFVKGFYRRPLKVGNKMQAGGGGSARTGKNPANDTVADCMRLWDSGTHMSKGDWARTCRRVQNRLNENQGIN